MINDKLKKKERVREYEIEDFEDVRPRWRRYSQAEGRVKSKRYSK